MSAQVTAKTGPLVVIRAATGAADALDGLPSNTVLPAISGTAAVGATLTCTTGTWTGDATITYAYHWQRDGVDIGGATASTYVLVDADESADIACRVTAHNGVGNVAATSAAVGPILPEVAGIAIGAGANSAYYRADLGSNTAALWEDQSGNDNDAVQASSPNRLVLSTGFNSRAAYKCPQYADAWFDLPSGISTNRRSASGWALFRSRNLNQGGASTLFHFGPGLTDFFLAWSIPAGATALDTQVWDGAEHHSTLLGRTDLQCCIWTADASAFTVRLNGEEYVFSPLAAGTLAGGKIGRRQDGYPLTGELYEWAKIDRVLTSDEIEAIEAYAQDRFGRPWTQTKQLVITGDSIGEGQQTSINVTGWGKLLDDSIGDTFVQRNYSSGGQYVENLADIYADNIAAAYDAGWAKNIFLNEAGTNDLVGHDAAFVMGKMTTLFTATQGAGFLNVGMTILPRADTTWVTTSGGRTQANRNADLATVNAWLLAGAGGLLDACVDLTAISQLTDPNNTTYFNGDKLHIADGSAPLIANAVEAVVTAL